MKSKQSIPTYFCLVMLGLTWSPAAPAANDKPIAEATGQRVKALESQVAASQNRIRKLEATLKEVDARIEKRVTKTVDGLATVGDSKDSGNKVSQIKDNVIDFMRKQISDYSRRRAQLRAALDSPNRVIPIETIQADIGKIDARIDQRIAQVITLGGSFASHQDYDKYTATGSSWYGGTEYRRNPDYEQNRKATRKANQEKGKLTNAIDENIKRLEFTNRTLLGRMKTQSAKSAERLQADITRNEALIEALKGHRVNLLLPNGQTIRPLGDKEAQSIYNRLRETGAELRRDQNTLTGTYNDLNAERARLVPLAASLDSLKKGTPQKP